MRSPYRVFSSLVWLVALTLPATGQVPPDLVLNPVGISVVQPLGIRHAGDGSRRIFIIERAGTVLIYHPDTGMAGAPFLDISSQVDPSGEGGLLGLAFHPSFSSNGYFYVSYTRSGSGNPIDTVVERYEVDPGDPNDADETSGVEIFTLGQPAGNHNGGDIHFGHDGFLYIGLGDGGYTSTTAQDLNDLLGKMLRIDPCATSPCPQPYAIPPSNPFVGLPGRDEIWSRGFRNPYRWSFDRLTGDMLVGDVGEDTREEVSFESAGSAGGANYGWDCREGSVAGPTGCSGTFVDPILEYGHGTGGCAITGGYRYRGCIPGLRGTYIFSDFCTAQIYFGTEDSAGSWSFAEWTDLGGSVLGFGEDEDGEIYVLQGESVQVFESATCVSNEIFADGFESGDTGAWTTTSP